MSICHGNRSLTRYRYELQINALLRDICLNLHRILVFKQHKSQSSMQWSMPMEALQSASQHIHGTTRPKSAPWFCIDSSVQSRSNSALFPRGPFHKGTWSLPDSFNVTYGTGYDRVEITYSLNVTGCGDFVTKISIHSNSKYQFILILVQETQKKFILFSEFTWSSTNDSDVLQF